MAHCTLGQTREIAPPENDLGLTVFTNASLEYTATTYGDNAAAESVVQRRVYKFYKTFHNIAYCMYDLLHT